MEQIRITINFGNAACQYPKNVPKLLRAIADKFENGQEPGRVMDLNGNSVGKIEYDPED